MIRLDNKKNIIPSDAESGAKKHFKHASIEITFPNNLMEKASFNLNISVNNSSSIDEEYSLNVEVDSKDHSSIFIISQDLKIASSSPLQPQEEALLNKEMINITVYKLTENNVLTKKEEETKDFMQKLKLTIPHRIKNSDLSKINNFSIQLNKQDQLFRLCNEFNFYSKQVQFYTKQTVIKCDKSENSFEAESIHISSSFSVLDCKNENRKEQNFKVIINKLTKLTLLILMYGDFFRVKLKEMISLTDEEIEGGQEDQIWLGVESFCEKINKIDI